MLEPEGTVEIKYRHRDLIKTMHRLDPICKELKEKLKQLGKKLGGNNNNSDQDEAQKPTSPRLLSPDESNKLNERKKIDDEIQKLEKELQQRENSLASIYHQISVTFADLHDTPGRMLSKHVIKDVIEWKTSRTFFYWRLRRLLAQGNVVKKIMSNVQNKLTHEKALSMLKSWFEEATAAKKGKSWTNNEFVAHWLESEIFDEEDDASFLSEKLQKLAHDNILGQVRDIIEQHPSIALESIGYLVELTSPEKIKQVIKLLSDKVNATTSVNESSQKRDEEISHSGKLKQNSKK